MKLEDYQTIINKRKLTAGEFKELWGLRVKQQNSHKFDDGYDGSCDHCVKQKLLLSQMTFGVVTSI